MSADDLARRLRALTGQMREGAADGLQDLADHVLGESSRIVPIEEGILSGSGVAETDRDNLVSGVGYGKGPAAAYAVVQHEDMTYSHDAGRQAKYLEIPFIAAQSDGARIIAAAVKRRMK